MRSLQARSRNVLTFGSPEATLPKAGGKGMNLSRLAAAGLPVPDGFIVTTDAYQSYIRANRLEALILAALDRVGTTEHEAALSPEALQKASEAIVELFHSHRVSPELTQELLAAYESLGAPPVAVRSSATAEDLPDLSFAGQQETYLNVVGPEQLLSSVLECWASLWTARAIGYRIRNGIGNEEISLAVVVQTMVASEASGVMFTANPLTGLRSETVIESTLGLGEALVSGQVEPDRFVVDTRTDRIVERALGAKATVILGKEGGGTVASAQKAGLDHWSLTDDQVLKLTQMGTQVAEIYGVPQDMEWATAGEEVYLLQSRPITSLFPIPERTESEPLNVFASFGAIQGILAPLTPFGADLLKQVFASASRLFGFDYTRGSQRMLLSAGDRLWVNVTTLLRNSVGRRLLRGAMSFIEPTVRQALDVVWEEPALLPSKRGISARGLLRAARFFLPLAVNVLRNMLAPERRRLALVVKAEQVVKETLRQEAPSATPLERLAFVVEFIEKTTRDQLPPNFVRLVSGVATGMASLNLLNRSSRWADLDHVRQSHGMTSLAIEVTGGVPHNPTTEMDLELWGIASRIKNTPSVAAGLDSAGPAALAERYFSGSLDAGITEAIHRFLERYGSRGLAEIDAGRTRWREEPQPLFETLFAYLQITDAGSSPEAVFERSRARAEAAVETIVSAAGRSARALRGRGRAARARFAASRARGFLGFREYPKFFAVRLFDSFRRLLIQVGEELHVAGSLRRPDDLVYLTIDECAALAKGSMGLEEAGRLILNRREEYRQESARRQIPRMLLSDGRAFYEGIAGGDDGSSQIVGSPVSPGSVEGRARVVVDPRESALRPGEIMVCPGTDPSWTPLFLVAGGLVMEVGGMMTHGAVVAREYGIPAVVGVHEATRRIRTGQLLRLDGSNGTVTVLDEQTAPAGLD